jgi:uncharacterized FlgJ-related protein
VNFSEVTLDDPRWTDRERLVLKHLFTTASRYASENRKLEHHGIKKAIYVMANVIVACSDAPPTGSDLFRSQV